MTERIETSANQNQNISNETVFAVPRVNKDCPNVDNFLYDGSNCDPGYWCGCSDPTGLNCLPSNDLNATNWAGHFTTMVRGTRMVYTGWASIYPNDSEYFQCADSLYCPGKLDSDASFCPTLCPSGSYCPSAKDLITCPEDNYCLIGSTEPTECKSLEECQSGSQIYKAHYGFYLVLAFAAALFGLLCTRYCMLNKKKKPKESKTKVANEKDAESLTNESDTPVHTTEGPEQKIDVAFNDLQLTLPNGKCIMQGVSGKLKAGTFTAIMGPSGAGKSTFLSLISGKVDCTAGSILVNGKEERSLTKLRRLVGYVPQEDTMLRELSVYENIHHAAMMRLPVSWTTEQKLQRVEDVLDSLDLQGVRDGIIGDEIRRGISGGQRKRVNVAMELVADPALLCCDEPTSGLDSTSSTKLCEALRSLAHTGVNVSAVLHQPKPEIFAMFDSLLLLGVGGRTVYLGPAMEMENYFTRIGFPLPPRTNPADYYMDVVAGLIACDNNPNFVKEDLFHLWLAAPENPDREEESAIMKGESESVKSSQFTGSRFRAITSYCKSLWAHIFPTTGENQVRQTPGLLGQTYLLFRRAVLQRIREPANTFWPLILSLFAGVIAGASAKASGLDPMENSQPIYFGVPRARLDSSLASSHFLNNYPIPSTDNVINLWQTTALVVMLVCVLGINVFGKERAVFFRDTASGTRVASYWAAKTMEVCMWLPVYAAVFCTTAYFMQPLVISLLDYWLVTCMAFVGFYGIGMSVSLLVGAENRGIVTLVSGIVLVLGFTGLLFSYKGAYFKIFYTFWTGQTFCARTYEAYEDAFDTSFFNELHANYDLTFSYGHNLAGSFVTAFSWHILALILLKVCDFRKQR